MQEILQTSGRFNHPATEAPNGHRLVVRWTIGDVRHRGFEMLRLSICCAYRLFGPATRYVVCVNSIPLDEARRRTGALPVHVEWQHVSPADLHPALRPYFGDTLIAGMGWKLVPLRICPERYSLALDNDCILWDLPAGMRSWLQSEDGFLIAQDVERYLGSFDPICPPGAFNCGIRGLPPTHNLLESLLHVLQKTAPSRGGVALTDEIEEQGLQAAAVLRNKPLFLVQNSEVSICSPFWPRSPHFGTCGAHFVGMNARHIPFDYYGRPADEWLAEHWERHRPALYGYANLPLASAA